MTVRQTAKWGVKSVGGLAANIILLTVWVDVVELHPGVAIVPNFLLISAGGYVVANHWIFPDGVTPETLRGHARQYAGMQSANVVGKAANYALYLALLGVVDYRAAWVAGAMVTFAVTYGLNKRWWERGQSQVAERT